MKRLADYSQHFLRSPALIKSLIGHTNIRKNDTVYDIGAGSGTISAVLAGKVKKVVAIELEPRIFETLRKNMSVYDNVKVVQKDFLTLPLPDEPYKIFANTPFHISSQIVHKITDTPHSLKAAYLIVQKQFARKLLIGSDYFTGQLGAMIAPWYTARIRKPLRRTDYWPHPNVDTVLLEIMPRPEPLLPVAVMPRYRQMIDQAFSDPKVFAKLPLQKAGIGVGVKPSMVRTEQWVAIMLALDEGRK